MKKVLVGYDGSDRGRDALKLAETLRAADDGRLIVTVVDEIEPLLGDSGEIKRIRDEYYATTFASAADELGYSDFERRVSAGSVAGALYQVAAVNDADVTVVGSTHRSRLGQALTGSVAESLLNGSPSPVAIAPNGYGAGEHTSVRRIGVAFDAQRESRLALHAGIELAREFGATLRLISVVEAGNELLPGRIGPTREGYVSALVEYFEDLLREARAEIPAGIDVDTRIVKGDPATALAVEGAQLDLLVIGSRGYGPIRRVLLGSVAKGVVDSAPCPLFVTPRSAHERDFDASSEDPQHSERETKPAAA